MSKSHFTRTEKRAIALSAALALAVGIAPIGQAMHIMEGYLPAAYCIGWGILCVPFLIAGLLSIQKTLRERRNLITLLAMSGAFIFVISSLKIPSGSGSCSHMTGTGLGAILFGPTAVSILGLIVLLFQALLLAHGGLTTLGANTFSMAIAGPFVSFGVYSLCKSAMSAKRSASFWPQPSVICSPTASPPVSWHSRTTPTPPSPPHSASSCWSLHRPSFPSPSSKVWSPC